MQEDIKYFKVDVKLLHGIRSYYIRGKDAEEAISVVENFKFVKGRADSSIAGASEVDFETYNAATIAVNKRKEQLISFDFIVLVPNDDGACAEIRHIYTRAIDEEIARKKIEGILSAKYPAGSKIQSATKISYEEFKKGMENSSSKFFKVVSRCGHVGDNMFYLVNFYVMAKDANEAAEKVKKYPRVKKTSSRSGIQSVQEITKEEYRLGRKEMRENPFLHYWELSDEERGELDEEIRENRQQVREGKKIKKSAKQALSKKEDPSEAKLRSKAYKRRKAAGPYKKRGKNFDWYIN